MIKNVWFALLAVAALAAYLLGLNELVVLAAGALVAGGVRLIRERPRGSAHGIAAVPRWPSARPTSSHSCS